MVTEDVTAELPIITVTPEAREQCPYVEYIDLPTVTRPLPLGDFSIFGFEEHVIIKALPVMRLAQGLAECPDELMQYIGLFEAFPHRWIIVDDVMSDEEVEDFTAKLAPGEFPRLLGEIVVRHAVPIIPVADPLSGGMWVEALLKGWYRNVGAFLSGTSLPRFEEQVQYH